jgi:hypothetical protein
MKYITLFLFFLAFTTTILAQAKKDDYPFKEKYSFKGSDCYLDSDIELNDLNLEAGKRYSVKYTINVGAFCPLYNPFFNGLILPPGQLAIYDENKKYLMNLTHRSGGSRRGTSRGDWVFMYGGSFIGSKLSFIAGDSFFGTSINPLKEGTYYLQMVFYQSFRSTPWEDILPEQDESYFNKTYSTSELFRSNAIKTNIVKAK